MALATLLQLPLHSAIPIGLTDGDSTFLSGGWPVIVTCNKGVNFIVNTAPIRDNNWLRTTTSAFVGSLTATASLIGILEGADANVGPEVDAFSLGERGGIGFGAIGRTTLCLGGMGWLGKKRVAVSICPWAAVH